MPSKYPDWSPGVLQALHFWRLKSPEVPDGVPELFKALLNWETLSLNERDPEILYRSYGHLPWEEGNTLLGKLITDPRMERAWASVKKRSKGDMDFYHFWRKCQTAIASWRGHHRYTRTEQTQRLRIIEGCSLMLLKTAMSFPEFDEFRPQNLWNDVVLQAIFEALEITPNNKRTERLRTAVTQSIDPLRVVIEISRYAQELQTRKLIVTKPNSPQAHVHFFIRLLCGYLKQVYGQPLYEVVRITTEVALDVKLEDVDLVRKLIRP